MVACCPLGECDERATVYNTEQRIARKAHACDECREPIHARERHEYISMLFDGAWSSFRMCLTCQEIGDHFSCGRGRVLETLWSDLEENFFPDMGMGGPCMAGLSPTAKAKLVERRMAWYLSQDEIDDSAWEDWPKHRDRQRPLRVAPPADDAPVPYWETPEYYWPRQAELDAFTADAERDPA